MKLIKRTLLPFLFTILLIVLSGCGNVTTSERSEFTEIVAMKDFTEEYSKTEGGFGGSIFLMVGKVESEEGELYKIRYAAKANDGVIYIRTKELDPDEVGFKEDGTNKLELVYVETHGGMFDGDGYLDRYI